MDINSFTISETIVFVGLCLGLLISIGIASLDPSISKETKPSEVFWGLLQHVSMQWFYALGILLIISAWVWVISIVLSFF
jgi:hypothetical protein